MCRLLILVDPVCPCVLTYVNIPPAFLPGMRCGDSGGLLPTPLQRPRRVRACEVCLPYDANHTLTDYACTDHAYYTVPIYTMPGTVTIY